jgi:TIR domain
MSYLTPHFDPDVFVSYSHGDPRDPDSPLKRWMQTLVRRLESQIRSLHGEFDELNLWIDRQLDPTAFLTEELSRKVSRSGVLMIVMSERYLMSDWCKDELDWFKEQVEDRAIAGGRVFIIRAQETETNRWPAFCETSEATQSRDLSSTTPRTVPLR